MVLTSSCPSFCRHFYDLHDGDIKHVSSDGHMFTIHPSMNNQSWVVHGEFDQDCNANIDFHVPGKPDYPPVNLTSTLLDMRSPNGEQAWALEFTDPSGTIAPPSQPLNLWMSTLSDKADNLWPSSPESSSGSCFCSSMQSCDSEFKMFDMHDGDAKIVTVTSMNARKEELDIQPYNKANESWHVTSLFDSKCVASVDFQVPGKPNPPPVSLNATPWSAHTIASISKKVKETVRGKHILVFTDTTSTIVPTPIQPVNAWVSS